MKAGWHAPDMPVLAGRTAVVTGASGGIGLAIARALAARGAHVVLASRHADRGARAAVLIGQAVPGASTETADGFEAHFGVNHLGHFALTGLLLGALGPGSRVVTMSSGLAAQARIDFGDLQSRRRYRMTTAYGQSKLAQLMFAVEFGRRLRSGGTEAESFAAHPGVARTGLMTGRRGQWGRGPGVAETAVRMTQLLFGAPPSAAALPCLYQATDPDADSSVYVGTKGHMRGYPAPCAIPPAALNAAAAERLWAASAELTGVGYDLPRPVS